MCHFPSYSLRRVQTRGEELSSWLIKRLDPMSIFEHLHRESKRQNERGRCLHFADGNRCNEIISAHSIQKKGQLRLIAEDGHVYRLSGEHSNLLQRDGAPYLNKIGIRRASTFPGFCKFHDNALFKPIDERPLLPTRQQVALYAYRCLCREAFVKENAVRVLEQAKDHPALHPDSRKFLLSSFVGHSKGYGGVLHHKKQFDDALAAQDYDLFEFECFTSNSPCCMQLSGLVYPDFDFSGSQLQNLGAWHVPPDLITCFTAPTLDGWALTFAWHVSSRATCIRFIQSLAEHVSRCARLEDALFRFCISTCENHAIRISWWDSLAKASKDQITDRMVLMAHPRLPVPSDYLAVGCEGIAKWSYQNVLTALDADA